MDTIQTLKYVHKILKRAEKAEKQRNFKLGAEYRKAAMELQRRLINLNEGGQYVSM